MPIPCAGKKRLCRKSRVLKNRHAPMFVVSDHDVEDRHELAHTCDHGDLEGFAGGDEPLGEWPDNWVEAHGADCGHVQSRAHLCSAAEDAAMAAHGAGVAIERSEDRK